MSHTSSGGASQKADPTFSSGGSTRRAFLAMAGFGAGAIALSGAPPASAATPRFIEDAFAGLAAFVLPGNDAFSKQQKLTAPGPGGVAAGAGLVVRESLDIAIPIQLNAGTSLPAPGALGYALILKLLALDVNPLSLIGPFANPFANLTWTQKRDVLERVEKFTGLVGSVVGYSANALSTIAGLGAYSERAVFDRRTGVLAARPVSWDYSNYGGRSDGWPEFIGYLDGVTEVPNP